MDKGYEFGERSTVAFSSVNILILPTFFVPARSPFTLYQHCSLVEISRSGRYCAVNRRVDLKTSASAWSKAGSEENPLHNAVAPIRDRLFSQVTSLTSDVS